MLLKILNLLLPQHQSWLCLITPSHLTLSVMPLALALVLSCYRMASQLLLRVGSSALLNKTILLPSKSFLLVFMP